MSPFTFLPFIFITVIYLAIIFGVLYLIYTWVNKFISLKQEQNEILREIAKKLESK